MRNLFLLVFLFLSSMSFAEGTFIKQGALVEGLTRNVTTGGSTVLTVTSQTIQEFSGSLTQTIMLPNALQMPVGRRFLLINGTSTPLTVKDAGGNTVTMITALASLSSYLVDNSTGDGVWEFTGSVNSFVEVDPLSIHLDGSNQPTADINWNNKNISAVGNLTATTVTLPGETASRALFLDGSNVVRASTTTSADLTALSGVTGGNIQAQLDAKANTALSNLTAPTAINQPLLFGTGIDVGSAAGSKPNVWVNNKLTVGSAINFGGTAHILQKPNFTMLDTNSANSITNVNGGLTATVNITSGNPNVINQVSIGDIVALSSAPTVFGVVTQVVDNSHFVVNPALGNGQIAQTIRVYPSMLSIEDSTGVAALYLNETNTTPQLSLFGNSVISGTSVVGGSITFGSTLIQKGATSGAITFNVPSVVTSYPLTWPGTQAPVGTFLKNNGFGTLTWEAAAAIEVDPLSIHLNGDNSPSADIAWASHKITGLSGLTFASGQIVGVVGSASTPFYTFSGDLTTGIYHSAASEMSMAMGGIQQVRFGVDTFGGGFILIPSEVGGILVGGTTTDPGASGATLIAASSAYGTTISANAAGNSPQMILKMSRGTLAVPTAVQANDFLGAYRFTGWNGSTYVGGAAAVQLLAQATETWTGSANGTNFFIDTTPTGSTGVVATLGIGADGSLHMRRNASTANIQWDVDGVANLGLSNNTSRPNGAYVKTSIDVGSTNAVNPTGAVGQIRAFQQAANSIISSQSAGASVTPFFQTQHSRGTLASPTATQAADITGELAFAAYTGSAFVKNAYIKAVASENMSGTNQGVDILVGTTLTTGSVVADQVKFTNNGWVVANANTATPLTIGNAGGGFSGIGITAPNFIKFDGNGTGISFFAAMNINSNLMGWNDGTGNVGLNPNGLHNYGRPISYAAFTNIDIGGTSASGVLSPILREETPNSSTPITTSNATQTTFSTTGLADNSVFMYRAECAARRTDAADRGLFIRTVGVFREAAGSATLQGPVQNDFTQSSDNTWDVTFTVSANNLLLKVTGASGKTINWQCNLRSTRVQ